MPRFVDYWQAGEEVKKKFDEISKSILEIDQSLIKAIREFNRISDYIIGYHRLKENGCRGWVPV
jgi:hypothetical protein